MYYTQETTKITKNIKPVVCCIFAWNYYFLNIVNNLIS